MLIPAITITIITTFMKFLISIEIIIPLLVTSIFLVDILLCCIFLLLLGCDYHYKKFR